MESCWAHLVCVELSPVHLHQRVQPLGYTDRRPSLSGRPSLPGGAHVPDVGDNSACNRASLCPGAVLARRNPGCPGLGTLCHLVLRLYVADASARTLLVSRDRLWCTALRSCRASAPP